MTAWETNVQRQIPWPITLSRVNKLRDLVKDLARGMRVRNRRKGFPVLFLPLSRGPIQNFYHFFSGYFVPLYWHRMNNPKQTIAVMAVTPFNHWFDLLPGDRPKIVDQAKTAQNAYLADSKGFSRHYRLEPILYWDKWEKFSERPLRHIASQMADDLVEKTQDLGTTTPDIVVLGRGHIPEYYTAELGKVYGAAKRNIKNLDAVVEALSTKYSVELVDGAVVSPEEIFVKCRNARLLLGQHGAGLTNAFFLTPGAAMLEIVWPELLTNAHINIYGPLCNELGVRWSRPVLQDDPHSDVPVDALMNEVEALLAGK